MSIETDFTVLWRLRMNQENEKCLLGLAALKEKLNVPTGHPNNIALPKADGGSSPPALLNVFLLSSSLARAQRAFELSKAWMNLAERWVETCDLQSDFYFRHERGLHFIAQGDSWHALDEFARAASLARDASLRAAALTNTLLCLEDRALATDDTLREIEKLLKKDLSREDLSGVKSQLHAFHCRQAFRNGHIRKILAIAEGPSAGFDQHVYFTAWVSELPFHKGYRPKSLDERRKSFFKDLRPTYQRSFRMRTLEGLVHPDDSVFFKPSDMVERFYLWTWRWLVDPSAFPVERLLSLLEHAGFLEKPELLNVENLHLLRNALLWLSLFDTNHRPQIRKILQLLSCHAAPDYPLLSFERLTLLYWQAELDRKPLEAADLLREMSLHPLWSSKELRFRALIEKKSDAIASLKPLIERLEKLRPLDDGARKKGCRIQVNIRTGEVLDLEADSRIVSDPLAVAFSLLSKSPILPTEVFFKRCFGTSEYDAFVHGVKIFNLLARIKKLTTFSGLRIKVRDGRILSEGRWDFLNVIEDPSEVRSLQQNIHWVRFLSKALPGGDESHPTSSKSSTDAERLKKAFKNPLGALSRRELEKALNLSRSSAGRLLSRGLRQGVLKIEGRARCARYQLKK